MIKVLRGRHLVLKRGFYFFAAANFLDGVISYWGYVGGFMKELNPLMNSLLFTHPLTFMLLKTWISAMMVGVGIYSFKFEEVNYLRGFFKWFLLLLNAVYALILLNHLRWIVPLFI